MPPVGSGEERTDTSDFPEHEGLAKKAIEELSRFLRAFLATCHQYGANWI